MPLQLSQANFGIVGQNLPTFQPVQGGVLGAGAQMGADIGYKQALAQQSAAQTQMIGLQSAVAKQGLTNDIISSAKDDTSYQYALKNLQKLGVDTSDAPQQYDPSYVGSKQMQSSHYLELLKAQATIQMTQLQRDLQANQINIQAMTSGMNAPFQTGQLLPATQQLNAMTGAAPGQPAPMLAGGMQAPMTSMAGGGMAPTGTSPSALQEAAQAAPPTGTPGLSTGTAPLQGAGLPGYLAGAKALGKSQFTNLGDMEKDLNKGASMAPDLEQRFNQALSANREGIPTGQYTEHLRQIFTPGAAQLMDKASANALMANLSTMVGVRPSIFLEKTLMKGLPENANQPDVNEHIIQEGISLAKWAQLVPKTFQALKAAGVNDPNDMENAIIETRKRMQMSDENGFYHSETMDKRFPQALNSVITGKAGFATQQDIQETAKKYGKTPAEVINALKAQNYAIEQ